MTKKASTQEFNGTIYIKVPKSGLYPLLLCELISDEVGFNEMEYNEDYILAHFNTEINNISNMVYYLNSNS